MFSTDLKNSITNFSAYRDFVIRSAGEAFKYIFLLITLLFVIKYASAYFPFHTAIQELKTTVNKEVPEFKLQNNELIVDVKQPYKFTSQGFTAIIDTTGATDPSVLDKEAEGVFLNKTSLYFKNNTRTQMMNYKDIGITDLSKTTVLTWIEKGKGLYYIGALPWYIGFMLRTFVAVFLLSIIALIFNGILDAHQNYKALWNISLYATTLPLLLLVGVQVLDSFLEPNLRIPFFGLLRWILAGFYVWKALKLLKNDNPSSIDVRDSVE